MFLQDKLSSTDSPHLRTKIPYSPFLGRTPPVLSPRQNGPIDFPIQRAQGEQLEPTSLIPMSVAASLASLRLSKAEFVCLVASLMALNAFAIDIMLPAMSTIASDFNVTATNDIQLIVIIYMIGFATSQLVFGPLSDALGRRRLLGWILIGYMVCAVGCALTVNLTSLLIMRFLLGIASGGTRVIAISVVRDLFEGRGMASLMSLVLTIFLIVPILAPSVGQIILWFGSWRMIFGMLAAAGLGMFVWTRLRLPETLPVERRSQWNPDTILATYKKVLSDRIVIGYALAGGLVFATVIGFISSSEQIFRDVFSSGDRFALFFAVIAGSMGVGTLINSNIVARVGMRRLSHAAVIGMTIVMALLWGLTLAFGQHLLVFLGLFAAAFFCVGFIAGNFNAIAMEPLGKIAGTGSAVLGFSTTLTSAVIGGLIAHKFDGTIYPLIAGFAFIGVATLVVVVVTERGRLMNSY